MTFPEILHFQATERCNLACPGCYLPERTGPGAQAKDIARRVFGPLADSGILHATLTGGEPLLHPEFVEICTQASHFFDSVQVVTNGLLLDREMFLCLREAGVDSIKVSLDGATSETHDALRGKAGAFGQTVGNLRSILALPAQDRLGVELGAIATVHPANVNELSDIARLAKEIGLDHFLLQPHHPFTMVYPPQGQNTLRPESNREFLAALGRELSAIKQTKLEMADFIDNKLEMLEALPQFYTRPGGPRQICGADRFVFVNSRMRVRGCLFCEPLASLAVQSPQEIFQARSWKDFQAFRRTCSLCLMGCQFRGQAQRLADQGFALWKNDRVDLAKRLFEASLAREYSVEAEHGLGLALKSMERLAEAQAHFENVLQVRPNHVFARADLIHCQGLSLREAGRFAEAQAHFREVLQIRPDHAFARIDLSHCMGLALNAEGRFAEAQTHFEQVLQIRPDLAFVRVDLGYCLNNQGKHAQALEVMGPLMSTEATSPFAQHVYGLTLSKLGRHAEALVHLLPAVEQEPKNFWMRFDLSLCLNRLGKHAQALEVLGPVMGQAETYPIAHHEYGLALAGLGRHVEASDHFLHAVKAKPDDSWMHFDLGMCINALGRPEEALEHFREAARLEPDMPWFHYRLGLTLAGLGREQEGLAELRQALDLAPDQARINLELGRLLKRLGEPRSEVYLRRAGEIDPALLAREFPEGIADAI